ncbi:hypothetical protein ACVDG3_01440 [Meridianimarinicoccus sp. RP-17]|uniref:hypothetical protein n=1 Tax=Meridianimarinicoccus zhengii TaxID=2056810 RepID=UPI001F21DB51|nr:hypothetical protein [Phycocomes zhengii]
MTRTARWTMIAAALLALPIGGGTALAEDAAAPTLTLDLNRVDPVDGACRLTFMATNATGADIDALTLEIVMIRTDGQVDRLTLFEFQNLPAGVPRVRQFDLGGLACGDLGDVLVNGVAACSGRDGACGAPLSLTSRTPVGVQG